MTISSTPPLSTALGGRRACGDGRTADSVYMECGLSLNGRPIEHFLLDPPQRVDIVQFGLSAIGTKTFQDTDGTTHIVDWIGKEHYETVSDFVEEAKHMGVSRKIDPKQAALLDQKSKMYLLHPDGYIQNHQAVGQDSMMVCPQQKHQPGEACAGLHWVVPEKGSALQRETVQGTYPITPRVTGEPAPEYTHAFFMVLPITCLSLIARHDGSYHQGHLKTIQQAQLHTRIADM